MQLFTPEQKKKILQEISEAELDTSGEIRVHIENHCKVQDTFLRGVELFHKLNMHKTEQRNGVLFYLALKDKKFAIIGDEGINQKVPPHFWDDIKTEMSHKFREGNFTEGLSLGIDQAGKQLKAHFPYQNNDKNELSDEISFNEN
jgi:uncharacterized membrane protein